MRDRLKFQIFAFIFVTILLVASIFTAVYFSTNPAKVLNATSSVPNNICSEPQLGIATDYNQFILGNSNQMHTSIGGRVAVKNDVNFTDLTIGSQLNNSSGKRDDLTIGGKINFINGYMDNGNITYGALSDITNVIMPNGTSKQDNSINFDYAELSLLQISKNISRFPVNGIIKRDSNVIIFKGSDEKLNVFDATNNDFINANKIDLLVPVNSTVLININNDNVNLNNLSFILNGQRPENIVFNLFNASKAQADGSELQGTLLAPKATMQFNNGAINGSLIVKNLNGNVESNDHNFTGCINTNNSELQFALANKTLEPTSNALSENSQVLGETITPGISNIADSKNLPNTGITENLFISVIIGIVLLSSSLVYRKFVRVKENNNQE